MSKGCDNINLDEIIILEKIDLDEELFVMPSLVLGCACRVAFSFFLFFLCSAGDRSSVYRRRSTNVAFPILITAAAPGKGGGVLDRPIEKVSPGRQSEFDVK
jgi:hypothetical protein